MSAVQAHAAEKAEGTQLRQPLSLRELFCLTTLAAVAVALVLYREWTRDERWLLGLTLGGTLLGILVARACGRRGWFAGILAGTLGGLIALCNIGQQWLAMLDERETEGWNVSQLLEFRNDYLAAAATAVIAVLLAVVTVACFQFLAWAMLGGERGMARTIRRHPFVSAAIVMLVGTTILVAWNIDFLLAPQAWTPRHFVPQAPLERPIFTNHGVALVRTGSLSRHGDWLIVLSYTAGYVGPAVGETELYQLDPQPRLVPLYGARPERAACLAFDCDQDRLAYLEWNGEHFYDRPTDSQRIHIVDLATLRDTDLGEAPRNDNFEGLRWHPGGRLVLDYDKEGHTLLVEREKHWSREEWPHKFDFKPKSGKSFEFDDDGMSIIDLDASRVIEKFSTKWVEEMTERLGGPPSHWLTLSPNDRFVLAGSKIYDRQTQTLRDWRGEDGWSGSHFYGFAGNAALSYDHDASFVRWTQATFLYDVPLAARLVDWLWREPIRLIDPATGLEVARTQPLASSPDSITFSYDGARMAVFNDEGVYIYDVPAKFR